MCTYYRACEHGGTPLLIASRQEAETADDDYDYDDDADDDGSDDDDGGDGDDGDDADAADDDDGDDGDDDDVFLYCAAPAVLHSRQKTDR